MLPFVLLTLAAAEPVELELSAERLLHDGVRQITTAEGSAVLTTDGAALNAERIVFDRNANAATASGHVVARLAQGGLVAITADVVTVRFDEGNQVREVFILDGKAVAKKNLTPAALLAASTAEALEAAGTTQALLEGNHLVRDGAKWTVEHLSLVPCECDFKKPSWSISASSATIDLDADRVSVVSPVVYVKHVPVLWFPWLSLPLTDRQTGLLFPRPNVTALNGFSIEQPVFLTLGRSADLTLTPGYFTGGTGPYGIAGPRLSTELRYVPSTRASGRLNLGVLYDLRDVRDVVNPALAEQRPRGFRGELGWQHTQDFDHGFAVRTDVNAHSDGYYTRDITPDVIAQNATYLRSTASVSQRGTNHLLALDATVRQDILQGYDWLGRAPLSSAMAPRFGPGTMQRWPGLTLSVPTTKLLGPLAGSLEADVTRLAPLFSSTGDEGTNAAGGTFGQERSDCARARFFPVSDAPPSCGLPPATGGGDRVWQEGEREARMRFNLMPKASVAFTPGDVVSVSAFAAWRQQAWIGEASGRTWLRGYPLLGARAETELARAAMGAVRHSIQPVAEVRVVPAVVRSSADPAPYDEVDAAIPAGSGFRAQAIVELRQRVAHKGYADLLRLDVGQGVEVAAGSAVLPAETYGRVSTSMGWFSANLEGRLDTARGTMTRVGATASLDDRRGHAVYASWHNLVSEGSARTRAPIDLLFGRDWVFTDLQRAILVSGGARWDFGPVALRYELLLLDRLWGTERALSLAQQTAAVAFTPACDCWRVEVYATQRLKADGALAVPDFGATLTVSRFGSIGTR